MNLICKAFISAILATASSANAQGSRPFTRELTQEGSPFGDWTPVAYCPADTWAFGFSTRVQPHQGADRDDSGLNAIAIYCQNAFGNPWRLGTELGPVVPHPGYWGEWYPHPVVTGSQPPLFLEGFAIRNLPERGGGWQAGADDSSVNSILFTSYDNGTVQVLEARNGVTWGNGNPIGDWMPVSSCAPVREAICGIAVKIQSPQGAGADDRAVTGVKVHCCPLTTP